MNTQKMMLTLLMAAACGVLFAQTDSTASHLRQVAAATKQALTEWDHEEEIKDMDLRPKIVTGGLLLNSNISNFIISNWQADGSVHRYSSRMKIGGEFGGFMDFYVTKHFAIQPQLLFMAEQNRFGIGTQGDRLWSFGMDIPVFFMGRWGNRDKGYLSVGAGPFTHFTFASNLSLYNHDDSDVKAAIKNASADAGDSGRNADDDSSVSYDFSLHDNHSGLAAYLGYEFRIGIQIVATYKISLTDIAYFAKENPDATFDIYPQRVALGIGYRFK